MCAGLCPTYWTTFGSAEKNRNGSCPMHEWDHPPFMWVFDFSSTHPPGAAGPQSGRGHVGRHCPYTNKIWCGSVHALLRYRSKNIEMQKFPIDFHSNISFAPFSARRGPLTPKRGEDTSGTRVRQHANFGVNRPAGCREIVDRTKKTEKHSKTNTSPFALTSEWWVTSVSETVRKPPLVEAQTALRKQGNAKHDIPATPCQSTASCE